MKTDLKTVIENPTYQNWLPLETNDVVLGPEEKDALYTLGYIFYGQEKYAEAIPFFTLLSLYEPNSARNYAALAACQKMTKSYEKAISNYAVALLLEPAHIEYILHIAECQIAALYSAGAIDTLNQLLTLDSLTENHDAIKKQAKALLTLLNTSEKKH